MKTPHHVRSIGDLLDWLDGAFGEAHIEQATFTIRLTDNKSWNSPRVSAEIRRADDGEGFRLIQVECVQDTDGGDHGA